MKKLKLLLIGIIIISMGLISSVNIENSKTEPTYEKTYCDGWEDGYAEGWCYEIPNCIKPIIPVCPIPKLGFTTYKDGYNRGFTKGKSSR